jgi:hypothetical protein
MFLPELVQVWPILDFEVSDHADAGRSYPNNASSKLSTTECVVICMSNILPGARARQ